MTNIDNERDSPKDVDDKILAAGFKGLYYFTHLLSEIYIDAISKDMRYKKIKGIPLSDIQKERVYKLEKLLKALWQAIKEFEWPQEKFIESHNIIFEEICDIKSEIRKTSFKGSPPRLRNKIGFYWALSMEEIQGHIDWELIARLLEWTHHRFRNSPWKNLIISEKENKDGHIIDNTEALEKYFTRNKEKKPLFPVSGKFWNFLLNSPYSIEFDNKKEFINSRAIGISEEAYNIRKDYDKSRFKKGLNPIIFKNKKIFMFEPNPPLIIFPDGAKLYLLEHIDNLNKIN